MPPVFGPSSPSNTRLWSWAEANAIAVSPSQSAKKFFHDHVSASLAKSAAEHHVDRGFRFRDAGCDHHAFAGGKPVGLDHDRRTLRAHIALGRLGCGKAFVGRGRNIVGLAKILGKTFGAFELRRRP